jgi:hypothetical protein
MQAQPFGSGVVGRLGSMPSVGSLASWVVGEPLGEHPIQPGLPYAGKVSCRFAVCITDTFLSRFISACTQYDEPTLSASFITQSQPTESVLGQASCSRCNQSL